MATLSDEQCDNICFVCLEEMSNQLPHSPVHLVCDHDLCYSCFHRMKKFKMFNCPYCRTSFKTLFRKKIETKLADQNTLIITVDYDEFALDYMCAYDFRKNKRWRI